MNLTELESALAQGIASLKPAEISPSDTWEYEYIALDGIHSDNSRWRELAEPYLQTARRFEIHCWKDETQEITLALQFGTIKPFDWHHGTVIEGDMTPEFLHLLLTLPKPEDALFSAKHTPFFTIMLDNGFSSSHYGTELILPAAGKD